MKVLKCDSKKEKQTEKLIYNGEELQSTAPEGIYSFGTRKSRYIVIRSNEGGNVVLYYYIPESTVVGSSTLRHGNKFTRLPNAKVIFAIKE